MAYTLFWWHPQRGVHHFEWDMADQCATHIQSMEKRELHWYNQPLSYYVYEPQFDTWWYYCKPQPRGFDPKTATAMQMRARDPWQRRAPEGVPREIRAYKLLLG